MSLPHSLLPLSHLFLLLGLPPFSPLNTGETLKQVTLPSILLAPHQVLLKRNIVSVTPPIKIGTEVSLKSAKNNEVAWLAWHVFRKIEVS